MATKTALTSVENKIPNTSNLAIKTESAIVENEIPDTSNNAAKTALANLSNSVSDISTLIKKSDYDTKIWEIENKYLVSNLLKISTSKCYYKKKFWCKNYWGWK